MTKAKAAPVLPVNAFIGRPKPPSEREMTDALGSAKALWDELLTRLAKEHGLTSREWHSYSLKAGWAMRLKIKDRNILYLSPLAGAFRVSFALGEKAMQKARQCKFPPPIVTLLKQAPRYAEGTAVRIDVTAREDITVINQLAAIKIES